ncbi:phytanoyl-CoA dioxygenase family protein [Reyranella sp.]|uniref:phytanoyl-CoA dioxygenase family protein n=1 Tax=Reyranella sp. TaxID=1929291 RepID=UPI003784196B
MTRKLSAEQVAGYARDGYVSPIDAFSPAQARAWRDRLEAFERAEGQKMTRGHNFKPHLLFPWVDEIVHSPAVLDAVEDLIGPDIRLFHLTVWPKDAGSGAHVSWHQDATYFALEPACHVTAWVALTDAPVEAGCMEVVPGSHKLGQLKHAEMQDPDNLLSRGQTLAVDVDRRRTVHMPVRAGQFSLHHTHLVHNSGPNRSHDRRIGLGISYIPTHASCTARRRVTAMLVRGTDSYGHFDDERRPIAEAGPDERAFHAAAVARFRGMNADVSGDVTV